MDDGNGLGVLEKTANTDQAASSQGRNYRHARAKATAPEANTANDQIAYLQMTAQTIENLTKCGISVRQWQAMDAGTLKPTVMIAIIGACLCVKCGNYFKSDAVCGICSEANTATEKL